MKGIENAPSVSVGSYVHAYARLANAEEENNYLIKL